MAEGGTFTVTGPSGKTSISLPYDVSVEPVTAAFNEEPDMLVRLKLLGDELDRICR